MKTIQQNKSDLGAVGYVPKKEETYTCDKCEKKTTKIYGFNDEVNCEDCFNEIIDRAENAYDSAREEGLI